MRSLCVALVLMLSAAGAGHSQSAAPPPDPVKIELARRLVAAQGGERQAKAQIESMFVAMNGLIHQSLTDEAANAQAGLYKDLKAELVGMAPRILDISVHAFASQLSEKELRDMLAFQESDSGRAITAKLPAVRQQIQAEEAPMMAVMISDFMQKTLDRVCAERHCTAEQRRAMEAAVAKVMRTKAT